jgi:dTMP kinase
MGRRAFIVLEGTDKAGKSTQAALLVRALRRRGVGVVHTREPGGVRLSEEIRSLLLRPGRVVPLAELLLYEAARAQHVAERIRPALARGCTVVCERFTLATLAYQAYGRGLPVATVRTLNRVATGGLEPDLTVVLSLPDSRFQTRRRGRPDRLESEGAAFRARVRRGYRSQGRGPRFAWVDADRPILEVHRQVLARVERMLR